MGGIGNQTYTYPVVAGSYESVMVGGGSVSTSKLQALSTKLEQTQTTLQSGNSTLIGALSREEIAGDIFYAGTLAYFAQYLVLSRVAKIHQEAGHNLPVSYGTFGYEPNVQSLFGLPRAITPGGVAMNVRLSWVIDALDGNTSRHRDLALQTGMLSSALEDAVPEQMFSTSTQPAQGVSAVKALQIASQQGQRVYHITPLNEAQVLPNLHLDSLAMSEITQALAIGKEVITHTDRISVPGWTGEGYILFDPVTGDGAYKIAGGTNGAELIIGVFWFLAMIVLFGPAFGIYGLVASVFALFNFFVFAAKVRDIAKSDLSPDQKFDQLNMLAFAIVVAMLGSINPVFIALGALGTALDLMVSALITMIAAMFITI